MSAQEGKVRTSVACTVTNFQADIHSYRMLHSTLFRTAVLALSFTFVPSSRAQQGATKEGFALTWDQTITVTTDSLINGRHHFPAWTITVFEADAGTVLDLWKEDMKATGASVSGSKPMKALGTRIPEVVDGTAVLALGSTEKKAKLARLTLAFGANDSTPTKGNAEQEAYMRSLAVKYNRAVVQAQVATYEKMLGKASAKLTGTQEDVAKNRKNITKASSKLEKLKSKRSKVEGDMARQQGDITGLEKKFGLTNDPNDLEKLTKARGKLVKSESSLADLMSQEADVQGDLAKYQGQLEENSTEAQDRTITQEEVQRTVDALKRKMDGIR